MTLEFTSKLETFDGNLWGYHFHVPDEIAEKFIEGNNRRVITTVNQSIELRSALMGSKTGWFIMMNKPTVTKHQLHVGVELQVRLEKDSSKYGMEMPEELLVLLDQDEEGDKLFHELTPGKQRSLIYIVSKVKNTNSRLNKALAIVHHLKEVQGKLDFKRLNETIKMYNQMRKLN